MSFDPRTRRALREAGVPGETLEAAAETAAAEIERATEQLAAFFEGCEAL